MSQQPPNSPQPSSNQFPGQGQSQGYPFQGNQPPQQGYPQQMPPQGMPQQQYQQPMMPQGYPQQQYQQPMMPQPPIAPQPKKKRGKGLLIAGIVAAILVFGCIGASVLATHGATTTTTTTNSTTANTATQPTQAPKATQAPPQKWTTTHTFKGSGSKKTESFTAPNDWKLVWTCDPTSFNGSQYNLIVAVTATDGSLGDPSAINTLCKASNTHDVTEEHAGGNVFLDVISEGDWTVEVQELK